MFIPSTAQSFCRAACLAATADAAHCDGVGPQSYGTNFELLLYDSNNYLVPIGFAHFVGAECYKYWHKVFSACESLNGYDEPDRVAIVDQENSIDKVYRDRFNYR